MILTNGAQAVTELPCSHDCKTMAGLW